jgi:hypothetical protein
MDEHVGAAVIGLDEAEALGAVEPLYSARSHDDFLSFVEFSGRYSPGHNRYLRGNLAARERFVKGHKQYSMRRYIGDTFFSSTQISGFAFSGDCENLSTTL